MICYHTAEDTIRHIQKHVTLSLYFIVLMFPCLSLQRPNVDNHNAELTEIKSMIHFRRHVRVTRLNVVLPAWRYS